MPLGDSITFGTPTNNGGYRVKLFIDAKTDNKKITFVGTAGPNGPQNVMVSGMSVPFPRSNEGYPGITIGDLDSQHISNGKAFTNKPDIVLLHIGTNDMYGGNPGGAPDRLKKIIDDIAMQVPDALIAVASIIPLPSGSSQVMTYNATIPGIVKDKAAAGKHVIFVDQFKDFPASELTDGVHPDDAKGYPRMGDVWYAAIKQYLH
jgi:lysophospholipase L1-like esterase